MQRVAIIGLDGAHPSSLGVMLDVLDLAGRYRDRLYAHVEGRSETPGTLPVQSRLLSMDGGPIRLNGNRRLCADERVLPHQKFDAIFLPSFDTAGRADLFQKLEKLRVLCPWLTDQYKSGASIAASGAATFLLAETGLLDHRIATAPWRMESEFLKRYPRVHIDAARTVTEADRLYCSSTLQGDLELAWRLVRRMNSPNVAEWVRKIVFSDTYLYAPQTCNPPELVPAPPDPLVSRAQFWLQERFAQKVKISDLADAMAVSERTLRRHFEEHIGMTPHDFLQNLRIEAAKQMLGRSGMRIHRIAGLIGYEDLAFFKKLFRERTGQSPNEYRKTRRNRVEPATAS